jgi:hypothetical protein
VTDTVDVGHANKKATICQQRLGVVQQQRHVFRKEATKARLVVVQQQRYVARTATKAEVGLAKLTSTKQ